MRRGGGGGERERERERERDSLCMCVHMCRIECQCYVKYRHDMHTAEAHLAHGSNWSRGKVNRSQSSIAITCSNATISLHSYLSLHAALSPPFLLAQSHKASPFGTAATRISAKAQRDHLPLSRKIGSPTTLASGFT